MAVLAASTLGAVNLLFVAFPLPGAPQIQGEAGARIRIVAAMADDHSLPVILQADTLDLHSPNRVQWPLVRNLGGPSDRDAGDGTTKPMQIRIVMVSDEEAKESQEETHRQTRQLSERIEQLREQLVKELRADRPAEAAELRESLQRLMGEAAALARQASGVTQASAQKRIVVEQHRNANEASTESASDRIVKEGRRPQSFEVEIIEREHRESRPQAEAGEPDKATHHEREHREQPRREAEQQEREMREREMREREMHEREMHEREMHEREMHEQHQERERFQEQLERRRRELAEHREREEAERHSQDRHRHPEEHQRSAAQAEQEQQTMRRVHALHEAAERLREGGIEDMAHALHQQAEQTEKEFRDIQRARSRQAHGARDNDHAAPDAAVHHLAEQVSQLRQEIHELHRKLDRLGEQLEHSQRNRQDR